MRTLLCFLIAGTISLPTPAGDDESIQRAISFEERVAAQRTVEAVHYSHRIGASRHFEEAVPTELLEQKVRRYLKQSVALEDLWGRPITSKDLDTELDRITRHTKSPSRLAEIYEALDWDPFVIRECFVRPVLADRLAREEFARDDVIHAGARAAAEELADRLRREELSVHEEYPGRRVIEVRRVERSRPQFQRQESAAFDKPELVPEAYERWRLAAPRQVGNIGPVNENEGAFVFRVVLEESATHTTVAIYQVKKRSWGEWWKDRASTFDNGEVKAATSLSGEMGASPAIPAPGDLTNALREASCEWQESWIEAMSSNAPRPRNSATAVWTGNKMIVWGGQDNMGSITSGALYDPTTDIWTPMSEIDAPGPPSWYYSAVWAGDEMIVWGGVAASGARYDPIADTWTATSSVNEPDSRNAHSAVWTGKEMIVWGGTRDEGFLQTGGRYDPDTDTWSGVQVSGAPDGRPYHSAVWTGNEMIVWGGGDHTGQFQTGGRYDPEADSWQETTLIGAPVPRTFHAGLWTGVEMLVWGGSGVGATSGSRYNPTTNAWSEMSTDGAPGFILAPYRSVVWSGSRMLVWGWSSVEPFQPSGGQYDPALNEWIGMAESNQPQHRWGHVGVWTGESLIAWGGQSGHSSDSGGIDYYYLNSGAMYYPTHTTGNGLDPDNDGTDSCRDNCPGTANQDQADFDGDGIGDACERGANLSDINGSGRVDGFDVARMSRAFGRETGQAGYDTGTDLDRDGMVDGRDLDLLRLDFGAQRADLPYPPTIETITPVSSSEVKLSWIDHAAGQYGFAVERAPAVTGPFEPVANVRPNLRTYHDTGLTESTPYFYRLRSIGETTASRYSETIETRTPTASVPPAPSYLTATAVSSEQIDITWLDNATNETGVRIERSRADEEFVLIATETELDRFSVTGLEPNTTYRFRVFAYNDQGEESARSNEASARTF